MVAEELFGKRLQDPAIQRLIKNSGVPPSMFDADERTYCSLKEKGVTLILDRGALDGIQFFAEGRDPEFASFEGELPFGLKFSDSAESARRKLGEPEKRGGVGSAPVLGKTRPWAKYGYGTCWLLLQFKYDESRIELVELTRRAR